MALGRFHFKVSVDTASNPDDTEVLPAPGEKERIYILWANLVVSTAVAATKILLENGVGGRIIGAADGAAVGTQVLIGRADGDEGLALDENTALNATNEGATGAVATVVGEAVVRGGH